MVVLCTLLSSFGSMCYAISSVPSLLCVMQHLESLLFYVLCNVFSPFASICAVQKIPSRQRFETNKRSKLKDRKGGSPKPKFCYVARAPRAQGCVLRLSMSLWGMGVVAKFRRPRSQIVTLGLRAKKNETQ